MNVSATVPVWTSTDAGKVPEEVTIASYPVLQGILGTLYFIIIFMALFGNSLVITAVTVIQERKTATHWLLVSLACADLTVTVLVMPFALTYDILGTWQYGATFCRFWMSWDVMCCTASLQHLCAIAWDRYIAITDPYHYPRRINHRTVMGIIIIIWINSALLSFFPVFTGLSAKTQPGHQATVDSTQCFLSTNVVYALISASISFYLPFVVMLFCYSKIFGIVWEKIRMSDALRPTSESNHDHDTRHSNVSVRDLKATKTLGILFGVLFFCWLPFFIVYWIDAFATTSLIPQPVHSLITWLGYLNSTMNPVIYSWNPVFRADYKQLFLYIFGLYRNPSARDEAEAIGLNSVDESTRARLLPWCSQDGPALPLTEDDIDELEQIFWPTKKPLLDRSTTEEIRNHGSCIDVTGQALQT